jgi:hypothetical protein
MQAGRILQLRMFLRSNTRTKYGKEHRYYTVVESRRLQSGKVAQRQVLYLGEINYQQNWAGRSLALLVLSTNDWNRVRRFKDGVLAAVNTIQRPQCVNLDVPATNRHSLQSCSRRRRAFTGIRCWPTPPRPGDRAIAPGTGSPASPPLPENRRSRAALSRRKLPEPGSPPCPRIRCTS